MKETPEIMIMRHMAWSRAKGELLSILATYCKNENFEPMKDAITCFINKVESEGLWE